MDLLIYVSIDGALDRLLLFVLLIQLRDGGERGGIGWVVKIDSYH